MKINKKWKERIATIFSILFFLFIIYGLHQALIVKPDELARYGRFTVATTGEKYLVVKSGRKFYYSFSVNGKEYKDSWMYNDDIKLNGGKYIVEFSSRNPSINKVHVKINIPKKYLNPPPEGWKELPFYTDVY